VEVENVLVEIKGYKKSAIIRNTDNIYGKMFEWPSWCNDTKEPTWCEYLMWERMDNSDYPRVLGYKYIVSEENDKKVEAWIGRGE
jgi:hypothetical protein